MLGLAVLLLWADVLFRLERIWRADEQYAYGYLIPLVVIWLWVVRWPGTPHMASGPLTWYRSWYKITAAVMWALTWLLVNAAQSVQPYGRLWLWLESALAVIATLAIIRIIWGASVMKKSAGVVLLLLLAVPWPSALEVPLTGSMALWVTTITVDLLNVSGPVVLQQGRLIDFGGAAPLGVDEACSGIRSLQLALAVAFCLGEILQHSVSRRLVLCVVAVVAAFLGNLIRTLSLAWVAMHGGVDHFQLAHDVLGVLLMAMILAGVGAVAYLLGGNAERNIPIHASEPVAASSDRWAIAGVAMLMALSTWIMPPAWFLLRGGVDEFAALPPSPDWGVEVESQALPESAQKLLYFREGEQTVWRDAEGARWMGAYAVWDDLVAAGSSRLHTPEVCLVAGGQEFRREASRFGVTIRKRSLMVRHFVFRTKSALEFHVFYLFWLEGRGRESLDPMSVHEVLGAVWRGERANHARMLQIYSPPGIDEEQARQKASVYLLKLLGEHN